VLGHDLRGAAVNTPVRVYNTLANDFDTLEHVLDTLVAVFDTPVLVAVWYVLGHDLRGAVFSTLETVLDTLENVLYPLATVLGQDLDSREHVPKLLDHAHLPVGRHKHPSKAVALCHLARGGRVLIRGDALLVMLHPCDREKDRDLY